MVSTGLLVQAATKVPDPKVSSSTSLSACRGAALDTKIVPPAGSPDAPILRASNRSSVVQPIHASAAPSAASAMLVASEPGYFLTVREHLTCFALGRHTPNSLSPPGPS